MRARRDSLIQAIVGFGVVSAALLAAGPGAATPANRAALGQYYDRFLPKKLFQCTTCHQPSTRENPTNLEEFPHNPFGQRLRELASERAKTGESKDLDARLAAAASLDSDQDGVSNEAELLLGHNPGNASDLPTPAELESLPERQREFAVFLKSYRWRPFETVQRPPVPSAPNSRWARNAVDAFVGAARAEKGLTARPEARRDVLLRRVYLDLIGLAPTPGEQRAFLADTSPDAYEKVVDRLLADPRHGERWARHWMDVWRYSDWAGWTDGNQVRDSKPHIWRWRDWIVESLNADQGYDRMVLEMLAADELAPLDTNALRATGFLVRNYKMLSREQWLEDTIKHTSQAFLGVTMGCAKCHDHMFDPISQVDYYRVRAIFEPHQVRTDKLPGELDTLKAGLVRAFDTGTNAVTRLFLRGDERQPDTNRVIDAGLPVAFCGTTSVAQKLGRLEVAPVALPMLASEPDRSEFVRRDLIAASQRSCREAELAVTQARTNAATTPANRREQELLAALATARHRSLLAVLEAERLEDGHQKNSHAWTLAAMVAQEAQRVMAVDEARLKCHREKVALETAQKIAEEAAAAAALQASASNAASASALASAGTTNVTKTAKADKAKPESSEKVSDKAAKAAKSLEAAQKKNTEAEQALAAAEKTLRAPSSTAYTPRTAEHYPRESTGRRLAFARWLVDPGNPLVARVAMNHLWMRHFGRGLVTTPTDFGRGGRPPSHPQLLDWLASEFMEQKWSMKAMHRLLVTSSTYRQASTLDEVSLARDPDNIWLWRMSSRRLEAEAIRDNLLYAAGDLDSAMGGPDIDQKLGLTSLRRSIYLRLAAEKEVEFLRIFDGPTVTECYERRPSVMPQQALALGNSELALRQAAHVAARLDQAASDDDDFIIRAYALVLARGPKAGERLMCREFLRGRAESSANVAQPARAAPSAGVHSPAADPRRRHRENLILVLLNHNDFITVR